MYCTQPRRLLELSPVLSRPTVSLLLCLVRVCGAARDGGVSRHMVAAGTDDVVHDAQWLQDRQGRPHPILPTFWSTPGVPEVPIRRPGIRGAAGERPETLRNASASPDKHQSQYGHL